MSKRFLKSFRPSLPSAARFFPLKKDFFESLRLPFQRELHL